MSDESLHEKTLRLLKESPKSTADIANGAEVNFYWLRKYRSGGFEDPSVNRVQKVYEYLTGTPLL
jgi:hypothetical protein